MIRESFEEGALTVVDAGWPSKELLDIKHLHGKAIVKFNTRPLSFAEIIMPLKAMAVQPPTS